jgi:hypothetical protein
MSKKHQKSKGRKPSHLIIKGNWQKAIKKAINKPKPQDGWPKKNQKSA